jgi:hypothetical protein
MVTQTSKIGNVDRSISVEQQLQLPEVQQQLGTVFQWVCQSAKEGRSAHEFERGLFEKMLSLGKTLFQAFLKLVGPGDVGETVELDDGRKVQRSAECHSRRLLTVFGEFIVSRWVYSQRQKAKLELIPTDQHLQLPESEVSYLLQEWDQLLGIDQAFGRVREVIETILRIPQSVETLERGNQRMAEAAPVFREIQGPVDLSAEGELLVVTEDNKGIPMVRPVEEKPAGVHRGKGEKANKKQMACIGCVYSVDRHIRTPEELVATLFRDSDRPQEKPPVAQNKRYWAELSRERDGEEVRGQDLVFEHLKAELATRRKPGKWLIHLCDGQASLETDRQRYLPEDTHTVDILDLMHVLPRVWEAAHVFHEEGRAAATEFVREHLTRILRGEVGQVIAGWRRKATCQGLTGAKNKNLRAVCAFLEKNKHRMRYDDYLRLGCPIATGVIEGACRHVIKDRMERAGMRWKIPGAQAMLNLRTIFTNGDWKAFQDFRIELEKDWLYPNTKALNTKDWPLALAV